MGTSPPSRLDRMCPRARGASKSATARAIVRGRFAPPHPRPHRHDQLWRDAGALNQSFLEKAPVSQGQSHVQGSTHSWIHIRDGDGPAYAPRRPDPPRPVTIADVYPTVGRSLNVRLPLRDGSLLEEALVESAGITPKLVVTVVWDGVGRNVLERWPEQWPTLRRLEREGTSYLNATVGSSPSITPSTHATWAPEPSLVNTRWPGSFCASTTRSSRRSKKPSPPISN